MEIVTSLFEKDTNKVQAQNLPISLYLLQYCKDNMSSSNNNDNGGFYTSDRRRGSDEATSSGISTSLFGGTNYTKTTKSKSTNNSRASELSSIGSNGDRLLHHIEKRVSSGKSCNTSELLNLLEKKVNGSSSDDRGREGRLSSSSKSCGGTSVNATAAQSNAAQVRASSSGSITSASVRTSSGRVRRLLLEQDASMSSSIATSTKPVFANNNNIQSLSYNHIDDDYSRSYNSSLATHITAQTTTGSKSSGLSRSKSIMEEDESLASIEDNNELDGNSFFSTGSSLPSRISHITNTSTSTAGTTLSLVIATIIQSNFNSFQKCQRPSSKQLLGLLAFICLLVNTIYNMTSSTSSLLMMRNTNIAEVEQQLVREERVFTMCNRLTPYQYAVNPTLPRYQSETQEILEPFGYGDKPIDKFNTNWGQPPLTSTSQKKILLLRNDGKFGHIGNQFNSILHAFDYAKDFQIHIGIFGHSWFMDVIQSMFYETLPIYSDIEDDEEEVGGSSNGKFDKLDQELYQDFGIIVIRNQTQLQSYNEIIYKTAEELYFYHSSKESWRMDMYNHILILRQLYMRYNRGLGVIHNGLQSQNICDVLDMFFEDGVAAAKYSVSKFVCVLCSSGMLSVCQANLF